MEFLELIDDILNENLMTTLYNEGNFVDDNLDYYEFRTIFFRIIAIQEELHTRESFIARVKNYPRREDDEIDDEFAESAD